jgi:short-subunit dehydrogenase
VREVASTIKRDHGSPSILINNAGIVKWYTVLEAPEDYLRNVFYVNTISHWFTVQEFLPDMLSAKKGHIVTICSGASFISSAKLNAYSATKASALSFHEGM